MKRLLLLLCCMVLLSGCGVEEEKTDWFLGADVSSLLAQEASGVVYRDASGEPVDLLRILSDAGMNCIRVRVWADPFDAAGNGYGGGNCTIETAAILGKRAAEYGMGLAVDFHYSDFWADPGKQKAPKAWAGMTLAEKETAIAAYTRESLETLRNAGVRVDLVQVGNETTSGFCGEPAGEGQYRLMAAAARAIRDTDPEIRIAVHYTNPESLDFAWFAGELEAHGVDYDVFATSYYPVWHGSLENLAAQLQAVAALGKQVMIAETAYPYTPEDSDGHPNSVGAMTNAPYPFTVAGQEEAVSDLLERMASLGESALGVFYWEPGWIAVPGGDRQAKWEQFGSGWASSFAGEYDPEDAGRYYGGSSWDNQTLFDPAGYPLESLKVFGAFRDR